MENSRFFPEIHGNFGFGCMRLPMKGGSVDYEDFCRMADAFIEAGFNYFDTAHAYLGGLSETAIRDCVAKRYPREKFLLTNKLTTPYFNKQEDIRPFVESQLKLCGVDYFDFYLMHAQDHNNYPKFQKCRAYETAQELKREGPGGAGLIAVMMWSALMQRDWLWGVGAVLFVVSDMILAFSRFVSPVPDAGFLIMVTYYAAQLLIFVRAAMEKQGWKRLTSS